MLLNRFFLLCFIILLAGCSEQKNNEPPVDYNNPAVILNSAKKVLGENVKFAFRGQFDADTLLEIAAAEEIENQDEWGIKFHLLEQNNTEFKSVFHTKLLEGSFRESLVRKIKFPDIQQELLYYNSQDYFLGSGGGEVFSYIINFETGDIYYAHLFLSGNSRVSLYLSENLTNEELRNFFISNFKRDFASLRVVSKDIDLEY